MNSPYCHKVYCFKILLKRFISSIESIQVRFTYRSSFFGKRKNDVPGSVSLLLWHVIAEHHVVPCLKIWFSFSLSIFLKICFCFEKNLNAFKIQLFKFPASAKCFPYMAIMTIYGYLCRGGEGLSLAHWLSKGYA